MPRLKSTTSIEKKINELRKKIISTKARYDRLCKNLDELKQEYDRAMVREIINALKNSNKSYEQLMTFLNN